MTCSAVTAVTVVDVFTYTSCRLNCMPSVQTQVQPLTCQVASMPDLQDYVELVRRDTQLSCCCGALLLVLILVLVEGVRRFFAQRVITSLSTLQALLAEQQEALHPTAAVSDCGAFLPDSPVARRRSRKPIETFKVRREVVGGVQRAYSTRTWSKPSTHATANRSAPSGKPACAPARSARPAHRARYDNAPASTGKRIQVPAYPAGIIHNPHAVLTSK